MATKRIIRISYFTMLTIIGGMLKIYIPVTTISFTMQTFFVIMAGLILGAKDGAISQIAYMLLGLIGLPIFTQGGGFGYVVQPSFGYIIGFGVGAFLTGYLKSRFKTLSVIKLFFCAFFGLLAIYLIGMPYQFFIIWLWLGKSAIAAATTLATLPLMFIIDAVMLYLVCLVYPRLSTMIGLSEPPIMKNNGINNPQSPNTASINAENETTTTEPRK